MRARGKVKKKKIYKKKETKQGNKHVCVQESGVGGKRERVQINGYLKNTGFFTLIIQLLLENKMC